MKLNLTQRLLHYSQSFLDLLMNVISKAKQHHNRNIALLAISPHTDRLLKGQPIFVRVFEILLNKLDFRDFVMEGILSFLLFAGSLHINADRLKQHLSKLQ